MNAFLSLSIYLSIYVIHIQFQIIVSYVFLFIIRLKIYLINYIN